MHKLVDAVNNLIINDARYYESNTATASDSQDYLTRNPETVTHTRSGNETANHTSNTNSEQQSLSNRTISVVVLMMNPKIEQMIAPIVLELQTLPTPATKEVVMDTALGGTWVNRNPRKVIQKGGQQKHPRQH